MAKKMVAPSDDYWKRGALTQRRVEKADEADYRKEIKAAMDACLIRIQNQIEHFYERYAAKEGITISEAKKRISQADVAYYEKLAKIYVKTKDFSPQANADLRLYNTMIKIDRLSAIEAAINIELAGTFSDIEKYIAGTLDAGTAAEFDRYVEALGANFQKPVEKIHNIVYESLKDAVWTDRLWVNNQKKLKSYLQTELEHALITGKSPRALVADFRKHFKASEDDALTLLTTEMTRCQTAAAQLSLQENGNEFFRYLTTNPDHPCDVCVKLETRTALKPIPVGDMNPGINAPPMHPRCHCTVAPWQNEKAYEEFLKSHDKR